MAGFKIGRWSALAALSIAFTAHAATSYQVTHHFAGAPDGHTAQSELTVGADGVLYGTTQFGGTSPNCGVNGCGTVYRVKRNGEVAVLHSFENGDGGAQPMAGLVRARDGNLYGTTYQGGKFGAGTLFRISPAGRFKVLHAFKFDDVDGTRPNGTLVEGPDGALYGTTSEGGSGEGEFCGFWAGPGCGTVFRYTKALGVEVMHSFSGESDDGAAPHAGLAWGSDGQLYGTTFGGGTWNQGTVFKITPAGALTVIHHFDQTQGSSPRSRLVEAAGAWFGTTFYGGDESCGAGCGVVFRVAADGAFSVIHRFTYAQGGFAPASGLVPGPRGRLFGTTYAGGDYTHCYDGCGTVYSVAPTGGAKTLHTFAGGATDGATPNGSLVVSGNRQLVGATSLGGSQQHGTIFTISP